MPWGDITMLRPPLPSPQRSSDGGRAPGFPRVSPIDPGKQIAQLRRRDRDRAISLSERLSLTINVRSAWPQKPALLQPLGEQAGALAMERTFIVSDKRSLLPDHLQEIALASTKAKKMAVQRLAPEHFLDLERQPRKTATHVGMTRRQPHPHPARNRDQRPSAASRMRRKLSVSTPAPTRTTRPLLSVISMR